METLSPQNQANQNQTPNPTKENPYKQWAPLAILLIAAAIVGWQLGQPKDSANGTNGETNQETAVSPNDADNFDTGGNSPIQESINKPDTSKPAEAGDTTMGTIRLQGQMFPSKQPMRGNVVLKVGDDEIYLWTNRDITNFIDKTIVVEAVGSMEKFTITDIEIAK